MSKKKTPTLAQHFAQQRTALQEAYDQVQPEPVSIEDLKARLKKGPVNFFFEKKDGTLREAVGTVNETLIPVEHLPKNLKEPSPLVVNFYDLENKGWRCFSVDAALFE